MTLLLGDICTLLGIGGRALLLVLTFLLGNVFTSLPVIVGRLTLLFVCSFADLLVFTVLFWYFGTFFVIDRTTVLLGHLFTLLAVSCLAVLLWYLMAFLVIHCLAVLLRDLLALLLVRGAALLVVLALVLVFCFAIFLGDCRAFLFIHGVANVVICYLTFSFYPGLTRPNIVKFATATAGKCLQGACDNIQCGADIFG